MGLLDAGREQAVKPVRERAYNASYVYGPAGGITPSEFEDIKAGDYDRETGYKRCVWCRQPKFLGHGRNDCCDEVCEKYEYGWIPWGKQHPKTDRDLPGRGWLSLG